MLRYFFIVLFLSSLNLQSQAQFKLPTINVQGQSLVSTGEHVPFWSISNKYGLYSTSKNQFIARVYAVTFLDSFKTFDYCYGFDGAIRADSKTSLLPAQAYIGIKTFFFNSYFGIKNEHIGTQDSTLSLGGFLYSANARSMPKIAIRTNDFVNIPFTFNYLQLKFGMSHGWLGDSMQFVRNAYVHDKYLYGKIKITKELKVYAGIHHVAMWGGTSSDTSVGKLPVNIRSFWDVFMANEGIKDPNLPPNEQENRYGNHIGSYQFGFELDLSNVFIQFYWQTMMEDKNGRVGKDWQNKVDGLWGLSILNKNEFSPLRKIVLEYFNSTNQSGDLKRSGGDNYYNNSIYQTGWTYYGMVIGNPLITSPAFYNSKPNYMINNRVRAVHVGTIHQFNDWSLTSKLTVCLNYGGVHNYPLRQFKTQMYSSFEGSYFPQKIKNTELSALIAFDWGQWLGNNIGFGLTYRRFFNL